MLVASTYDILQVDVDKVVERVEVLLYETFDGEESWEELPLVLVSATSRISMFRGRAFMHKQA